MTASRSQPSTATPVCCYCDADLSCAACGREQPHDDISTLKARVAELEANEMARSEAYEAILGERTYNEVAEHIMGLEEALEFYANPENYHAITVFGDPPCGGFADDFGADEWTEDCGYNRPMPGKRARAALSHAGPVARDGERNE